MRKALSYGVSLCLILGTGCGKHSSYEKIETYFETADNVPVTVYVGNPNGGVSTRSVGAVDARADLSGKSIRVWAFLQEAGVRYDKGRDESDPAPSCLIDGKWALLGEQGAAAEWADKEQAPTYYYYPNERYSGKAYDFTACYVDDSEILGEKRSEDAVVMGLRINGRQDIMAAHAIPPQGKSFCYNMARSGIEPIFSLRHLLVKLHFRIKPGVIPGREPKEITITHLSLKSQRDLQLTVARQGGEPYPLEWTGAAEMLALRDSADAPLRDTTVLTFASEPALPEEGIVDLGGSRAVMLLPEAAQYEYTLGLKDNSDEGEGDETKNVLRIKNPDGTPGRFEAGKSYVVTFEVFGASDVSVSVSMVPWEEGDPLQGSDDEIQQERS